MGPDPVFAGPAQPTIAEGVKRCVFALVLVVLLTKLLDDDLELVVRQRWDDILEVVLKNQVVPGTRVRFLEVCADREERVVP